jgi:Acyl-CoA carboxylase epsilon subunit
MPAPPPPAGTGPAAGPDPDGEPLFAIAAGSPTASEIAAVVTVLAARLGQAGRAGPAGVVPGRRSGWSARSAMMRGPLPHGPGAWRAAALPR